MTTNGSEERPLPDGWTWTKIGEVAKTTSGGTPSRKRPEYYGGSIPWVKSGELGDSIVTSFSETITEEGLKNSSAKVFPAGTALVALYGATVGKTGILGIDAATNQAVCAIFPEESLFTAKYMTYWLRSQRDTLIGLSSGGAQPNISQTIVKAFPFPLAPLVEQERIVAEIEKQFTRLDQAVASLRRLQSNLARYKASVLKAACDGRLVPQNPNDEPATTLLTRILAERRAQWQAANPGKKYKEVEGVETAVLPDLPEGWVWVSWEQLSPRVTVGHVGSMKDEYVDEGIPFLRSQNVRENRYDPEGLKFISPAFDEKISKSQLKPGDIVVVRSGSVGVTCVIPETLEHANCSDLVIIQKPSYFVSEYGAYYMNSLAKRFIRAGQVGVALVHFNTKSVAALPLPLPPLAEQERIVAEVERRLSVVTTTEQAINANLSRAERLRQAILHRAFTGQLV